METKTKNWSTGTGSATIQYGGQGDGEIVITTDPNNLYEARSMQITVKTTDGSGIQRVVTVNQAAKQRIDISNAVVTASNQTYSGSAKTPTPTVTLNGTVIPSTGYDVTYSNNINAGTATITVTGKGDYTGTATGTFTINKATPSYTAPSLRTGLTYSGSSQYLTTSGQTYDGTIQYSTNGVNWYSSRRSGTNAGDYDCYWRLVGDSNHTDISSTYLGTANIAKASRSMSWSYYPSSLYVGRTGALSATASAGGSDGTISYSSSNSSKASVSGSTVTAVASGTCTIYASISEGTNYLSASTSYTLTVNAIPSGFVDLGLPSGLLWAKCNLGASVESDYGEYFSWGNVTGHNDGDGYDYGTSTSGVYASTTGANLTGDIPANSTYDAARAYLGSPCHMPSTDDYAELYNNTDRTWTTVNGINGWKFMKKSDHSVYVFFPAGGYADGKWYFNAGSEGQYWSNVYVSQSNAYIFYFNSGGVNAATSRSRHRGATIKAVRT